ncbi:MAG: DUF4143 domain-containing protein, partial [Synergistaceae bacterium]|nr:DUF4143 domain-containing protein [Synergistaceae bacterium]
LYFAVGGMPRSVSAYLSRGLSAVRPVQERTLTQYANDFAKRMSADDARHAVVAWEKLQTYIGRPDPKALFGRLRHEPRMPREEKLRDFVQWFADAGLISRLWRIGQAEHGFAGYRMADEIKAYSLDIGLLGAMLGIEPEALIQNDRLRGRHLGTLAEQFVMQELVAAGRSRTIGYWNSPLPETKGGKPQPCEVDFLLDEGEEIVPLEVKSVEKFTSRSLDAFRESHPEIARAVRVSPKNFGTDSRLWALPLYAVSSVSDFLKMENMPWNQETPYCARMR